MNYLLETTMCSLVMENDPQVIARLASLSANDYVFTCPTVKGEIRYGIERLPTGKRKQDLEQKVIAGEFREDLYYRLNVIQIRIPPLRERTIDIPLLSQYFMNKYSEDMAKETKQLSSYAMDALKNYHFPGNVRELENIIERSVALEASNIILPESLTLAAYKQRNTETSTVPAADMDIPTEGIDLDAVINELEKALLLKALERSKGVKKKAAELLNITFRSLRYRLEKHGMDDAEDE